MGNDFFFAVHEEEMTCLHEAPRHVGDFKVVVMVDIRIRPAKNHAVFYLCGMRRRFYADGLFLACRARSDHSAVQRWQRRLARAATADGQDNFHDIFLFGPHG
jgi:hypothetical protein